MAGKSLRDELQGMLKEILNMDNPDVREAVEVGLDTAEQICKAIECFMSDPKFNTNAIYGKMASGDITESEYPSILKFPHSLYGKFGNIPGEVSVAITDEPIIEPNPDLIQEPIQMVYLAGPVDNADEKGGHKWRDNASDWLYNLYGIASYQPQAPWRGLAEKGDQWWILHAQWLDLVNRAAITGADALLVNLTKPSLGTTREVEFAKSIGKPVFIFTGGSAAKNYLTYDLYEYNLMLDAIHSIYNYGR